MRISDWSSDVCSSDLLWLAKAGNQNYFRGPENSARVREWRARHPGDWRKKKPAPLQERCCAQHPPDQQIAPPAPPDPLQELCGNNRRATFRETVGQVV